MANKTTDTGIPGYNTATDEEVANFSLDAYCIRLLLTEPFFAEVMRNITKIRDEKISTAGVTSRDGDLYLYWNPKFCASMPGMEMIGLLKHECYHLIFQHCTTRRMEPHNVHNMATDLAINSIIPFEELPKCGLIPGHPLKLDHVTDPMQLLRAQKLSDLIKNAPVGKSADWYFSYLLEEMPELADGGGEGEGEGGFGMDEHEGWGEMSDEERAVINGKIKEAVGKAVKQCDRNGQWGSVSAEMRETLRKLVEDSVDWKRVLQNFVGTSQRLNKSSTLRKLNRKYPYIHPGVQRSHTAHVLVAVDMSGSVGDSDLERIYAVLGGMAKRVTFTFLPFDYTVDEANMFEWKKGQKKPPVRFRSGGTSFIAVNEFVKKHRNDYDGVIICTDGEAEDPGPSPIKRAWLLVPDTKLLFNAHNGDIVIKMDKDPNKKAQAA
jgi:predicted metal-dependent peptidase